MIRNLIYLILFSFLVSCSYEFPVTDEEFSSGNIDLTNYIAVGDNYSAGFMNGALYTGGQVNSFPAILSEQFTKAGSNNDEFLQPVVSSEYGYNPIVSEPARFYGKWIYKFSNVTDEDPIIRLTPGELLDMFTGEKNRIRNFSVPLVKSFQLDRIDLYNQVINALADEYNDRLVVVDLNSIIHEISETGKIDAWGQLTTQVQFDFNGVPLEARLGYNSIFSLDGLHFNPRGNAFIANRFIRKMNDNFGSNIRLIDVNQFVGNTVEE